MPDPRSPEERLKRRKKAAKAALAEAQGYPTDSLTEEEKGYLKAMQKPIDKMPKLTWGPTIGRKKTNAK